MNQVQLLCWFSMWTAISARNGKEKKDILKSYFLYLDTLVSQVSLDISQKAYYLFKRTIYKILCFSVTIWVKKKIKNVVRYLTSNLGYKAGYFSGPLR